MDMKIFKEQVKDYVVRNKIYLIIFWIYTMIMTSVMAGVQADIPFTNLRNYFDNNHIIIIIMIFQCGIMILALIKNSYPRSKMLKQNIKSYFVSNVIISIGFSLITSILIIGIFYVRILFSNDLSSYGNLYFFGLEINKLSPVSILKIISYCVSILLAIVALSNLLCLLAKLWTRVSLVIVTVLFILSIWKKDFVVTTVTSIFQANSSVYLITLGVFIVAILIFAIDFMIMRKNYIANTSALEN